MKNRKSKILRHQCKVSDGILCLSSLFCYSGWSTEKHLSFSSHSHQQRGCSDEHSVLLFHTPEEQGLLPVPAGSAPSSEAQAVLVPKSQQLQQLQDTRALCVCVCGRGTGVCVRLEGFPPGNSGINDTLSLLQESGLKRAKERRGRRERKKKKLNRQAG